MKLNYRLLLIGSITLILAGCHLPKSIKSDDKEYLHAVNAPPLRIPTGMSSEKIHNTYPVSQSAHPALKNDVSIVPPGL